MYRAERDRKPLPGLPEGPEYEVWVKPRARSRQADPAEPLVILGTGPVAMRLAENLLRRDYPHPVLLIGAEGELPYNRVQLSALLAGRCSRDSLQLRFSRAESPGGIHILRGARVAGIDRPGRRVLLPGGETQGYRRLVLATGARPRLPEIPGIGLPGVSALHTLAEVQELLADGHSASRIVVIGGGPLGIEAAEAMLQRGARVSLVESGSQLLRGRLDAGCAAQLAGRLQARGIQVYRGARLTALTGKRRVDAVQLDDGLVLPADRVVLATGAVPETALAADAGLDIGRGIVVDEALRTSDPQIHALGDCAEFAGKPAGLAAPGYAMAEVLAACLCGEPQRYRPRDVLFQLKLQDDPVRACGETGGGEHCRVLHFCDAGGAIRRTLYLRRGRLVGAASIDGGWEPGLEARVARRVWLWPWQYRRFRRAGLLGSGREAVAEVRSWPAERSVCHCMNVSRGELGDALLAGCDTVELLSERTGAGSVCGTCRVQLAQLLEVPAAHAGPQYSKGFVAASLTGALLALLYGLLPQAPVPGSVEAGWYAVSRLWTDSLARQISGFTLLGLLLVSALLAARKRIRRGRLSRYPRWRLLHALLGAGLLGAFALHTGADAGHGFNRWLMGAALIAVATGGLLGLSAARRARTGRAGDGGRLWFRVHLLAMWPLPVLILFHVIAVYYF